MTSVPHGTCSPNPFSHFDTDGPKWNLVHCVQTNNPSILWIFYTLHKGWYSRWHLRSFHFFNCTCCVALICELGPNDVTPIEITPDSVPTTPWTVLQVPDVFIRNIQTLSKWSHCNSHTKIYLGQRFIYGVPAVFRGMCDFWLEFMMTSSNGNIFRVTGHLCGEFTGNRWIPHTKTSDAELWCFLWSASE